MGGNKQESGQVKARTKRDVGVVPNPGKNPQPEHGPPTPSRHRGANGIYASPGKAWSSSIEKHTEQLIEILLRQVPQVASQLDAGPQRLDPAQVRHMHDVLVQERAELADALTHLPSGSPLMQKAFDASDRAGDVIKRLEQAERMHEGHASVGQDVANADDEALILADADKVRPLGYCDTAPQGVSPCPLIPEKRHAYRETVIMVMTKARENWKLAIAKAQIEEKLKTQKLTFEQKLGELLLSVLFSVVGDAVKKVVPKGMDALDQKTSTYDWKEGQGFVRNGVDEMAMDLGKGVVNTAVQKGPDIMKREVKEQLSGQDLADKGSGAIKVPADRNAFLASLMTFPDAWFDSIAKHLPNLADVDLAGLVRELPLESNKISTDAFKERIDTLVEQFSTQVDVINKSNDLTPVRVVSPHGIRHALVTHEKQMNDQLHGEWGYVPVQTGRWTFVRWIDDQMKDMAVGRAGASGGDVSLVGMPRAADDAHFWDEKSLKLLRSESSWKKEREEADK